MRDLAASLEVRHVETMVPLLPGHGTTPGDLSKVKWVDWAHAVEKAYDDLAALQVPVFIAGHSVGGALALLLASERSVHGVVALSAPYRFEDKRLLFLPLVKHFVGAWKKTSRRKIPAEAGYDRYPLKAVAECQRLLKVMRRQLHDVTCPVLLLHAMHDYRVSVGNVYRIAEGLGGQNCHIQLLPYPAHTVTRGQNCDIVIKSVWEFIRSQLEV